MGQSGRIPPIRFKQLWENHPTVRGEGDPCSPTLNDQCAIKMGTALHRSGVTNIPGVEQCWFNEHKGRGHYLRAEDLAKGLRRAYLPGIQQAVEIHAKDFYKKIFGRTGIIFFKDYWRRTYNGKTESFRNRSGDHIDLWNRSRLTDWFSWARIHVRIGEIGWHTFDPDTSDLEDSKEIWFWAVP